MIGMFFFGDVQALFRLTFQAFVTRVELVGEMHELSIIQLNDRSVVEARTGDAEDIFPDWERPPRAGRERAPSGKQLRGPSPPLWAHLSSIASP